MDVKTAHALLENAFDYMLSAAEHGKREDARSLKNAPREGDHPALGSLQHLLS